MTQILTIHGILIISLNHLKIFLIFQILRTLRFIIHQSKHLFLHQLLRHAKRNILHGINVEGISLKEFEGFGFIFNENFDMKKGF